MAPKYFCSPQLLYTSMYWHQKAALRGLAIFPQGNWEPLIVRCIVGRPTGDIGVRKSMECDTFPFCGSTLLVGWQEGIRPVWVSACWWRWFDWCLACLIVPVVTTTSIILSCNKIQIRDIPVPAYLGWPWKRVLNECRQQLPVLTENGPRMQYAWISLHQSPRRQTRSSSYARHYLLFFLLGTAGWVCLSFGQAVGWPSAQDTDSGHWTCFLPVSAMYEKSSILVKYKTTVLTFLSSSSALFRLTFYNKLTS